MGDADKISETTEVVTAPGGGDTTHKSSAAGRKASGAGGIGTDVAVIPFGTTTTTATRPTRLERSGVFFLWEVGSCSNTVPEFG